MTPDEQPQLKSEQTADPAAEENRRELKCNGHASTPESESTAEAQESKQLTEEEEEVEEEDQQNANPPESNTETKDSLNNNTEHQACNGSRGDLQQVPAASLSPVTVELNKEEKGEMEEMDTRVDTRKEDKEKDDQNGLCFMNCFASYDSLIMSVFALLGFSKW